MQLESTQRGLPDLPLLTVPHPLGGIAPPAVLERARGAVGTVEQLLTSHVSTALEATNLDSEATKGQAAQLVDLPAHPAQLSTAFDEREWSDGLPVVPPTEALVDSMLEYTDRDRLDVLGVIAPRHAAVTIEAIAINAVMAGCEPRYLPVIIAAVEAMLDPEHNLTGLNATTHPTAEFILVSGPIAAELGVHGGSGCFGPGFRANTSIGRAIRLILLNLGGARPGGGDWATQASPAKLAFCAAENDAANPWAPFHTTRGLDAATSAVTVFSAEGPHNIRDGDSETGEGIMRTIVGSMSESGSNNLLHRGDPLLALCPEHAATLARDGWSREDVQAYVFEHARVPASGLSREMRRAIAVRDVPDGAEAPDELPDFPPDTLLPIADGPETVHVIVAGGPGKHSSWMPNWGRTTRPATRAITTRDGRPVGSVEELRR